MNTSRLGVFVIALTLAGPVGSLPVVRGEILYEITDLGTLGGTSSDAWGINDSGYVVGYSYLSEDATYHAFLWRPDPGPAEPHLLDLDPLGAGGTGTHSYAYDVNNNGNIVGYDTGQAFCTSPYQKIDPNNDYLGTLGGSHSYAHAINIAGQVVGLSYTIAGDPLSHHAFRWDPGDPPMKDITAAYGNATDINDLGQAVGWVYTPENACRGFRTSPNSPVSFPEDDLGFLRQESSAIYAMGINNLGEVVGYDRLPDGVNQHAFRTSPNSPINPATDDLGTLGGSQSNAQAINEDGDVVGSSTLAGDEVTHAFLCKRYGPMVDLNTLVNPDDGWVLETAIAINNRGQIVGSGAINGETHGFLLTPVRGPSLTSSEPPADGTLSKIANNVILLTFNGAITLPADPNAPALSIVPLGGGSELGDQFLYSVEPNGVTLKAAEDADVLMDQTWYRVTPTAEFAVKEFALDFCTLRGDCNGSCRVTTADYSCVKEHMSEYTDARYDLNGTGRVTTSDYSVVKDHMNNRCPAKP